jgi:predicted phosphodiesterase
MRLALIGDVHASPLLRNTLDFVDSIGVDDVLCVGDLCDGEGSLSDTIALLRARDARCVRGNHERWLLAGRLRDLPDAHTRADLSADELAWIEQLPVAIAVADGAIVLTHALFEDDMTFVREDTYERDVLNTPAWGRARERYPAMRVLVTGHTHRRMVRRIDGVTFINPGTLFPPHQPGFCVFDTAEQTVRCFDFSDGSIVEAATISLLGART